MSSPTAGPPASDDAKSTSTRVLATTCQAAPDSIEDAHTVIVLDWDGGPNPFDNDVILAPLAPSDLPIASTIDLETAAVTFQASVQERIETILCGLDPVDMRVIHGHAADWPDATHVHFTMDVPPNGGHQAGQGDYDPCNSHNDDVVIVWAGRLMEVAGQGRSRDDWANILANVAAHEIGHTLGFAHPDEVGLAVDASLVTRELMMSTHTIGSLTRLQAFLVAQDTCPVAISGSDEGVRYEITTPLPLEASSPRNNKSVDGPRVRL